MYVIETRIKTRSNKTIWMPYKQYRTTNGIENFQKRHQYLFDAGELRVTGNLMTPTLESDYFPLLPGLNTLTLTGATAASLAYRPLTLI